MTNSEILIYQNPDGNIKLDVRLEDETVWLSQEHMARLFGKGRSTITEHINNIFKEGELDERLVCRDFRHTTKHGAVAGKTQEKSVKFYNLDVIISVGYRVKSLQGTQFRIWATQRLREYIVKGFNLWGIGDGSIKKRTRAFRKDEQGHSQDVFKFVELFHNRRQRLPFLVLDAGSGSGMTFFRVMCVIRG